MSIGSELGEEMLDAFGEPVSYDDGSGPVTIQAKVRDRGARERIGRGKVMTSDAVATVSDQISVTRSATLTTQGGSVYRVESRQIGVPGTRELTLTKLSGDRFEAAGIADDMIDEFGEPVLWNGDTIMAHIVRTAEEHKIGRDGSVVQTTRVELTVRTADAPGLKPRDEITFDGRTRIIRDPDHDGYGLIRFVAD
jgi:hypothetical protein